MLSWWLIAILVFVVFFAIFKSQDLVFAFSFVKKNLFPIIMVGIVLFFCFSFYHIYTNNNIDLKSYNGVVSAGKLYLTWFSSLFHNVGKITGYVVQQDWVLQNSTVKNVTKVK